MSKELVKQEQGFMVSPEQRVAQIKKKFALITQVKAIAIKNTRPSGWLDQSGNPYLTEGAAVEIAKGFDLNITGVTPLPDRTIKRDGFPDEIIFSFTATVSAPGLGTLQALGACSTWDNFLGKKNGEAKELKDVDIPSVIKKAYTNLTGNAIRHFLSLNGLSWNELESLGIKKSEVASVSYSGKSSMKNTELQENEAKKLQEIKDMCAGMFEGDATKARAYYLELTKFNDYKGQDNPNRWSEKQVRIIYGKVKTKFAQYENSKNQSGPPNGNNALFPNGKK